MTSHDLSPYFRSSTIERMRRTTLVLLGVWTVLIALSTGWNLFRLREDTVEKARIEARTILDHNVAYRRWNTMLGGVYAVVGPRVQPNPYIVHPRRDIRDREGRMLTQINPFQMTKQTYELLREQSDAAAINRTVSLNPLNPENAPDAWEAQGLRAFEAGRAEVSGLTTISGRPYMRVLKPYVTVEGCLSCHGMQGYRTGDIRGGMSIAVAMAPYFAAEASTRRTLVGTHAFIWFAGAAGIVVFLGRMARQQRQAAEGEWKFRTLSEFSQDMQYWLSEEGAILYMTPSCERITGYRADEFMADPSLIQNIIHPDDREVFGRHMREDMRRPLHEEIDFRIVTRTGQTRRLFHICGPIYIENTFLGRHVSNRDVTERKQLEEQLMQSQKMESLGLFAGGIAHDFNNLLTVITGYMTMIQKKLGNDDEDTKQQIRDVLAAALKARSLTASLLSFGRKQVMRLSTMSLTGIIRNTSMLLQRIIGEDIDLQIRCSDIEFPVHADRHQIEQVIMNLLANARDAMPRGGTAVIAAEPVVIDSLSAGKIGIDPGKYMLLTVRDTGEGISAENIDRIFEPFFTTKEAGRGTGLGLAMVYGIVKQHEGSVTVESEPGAGTTFRIYLPASRLEDAAEAAAASTSGIEVRGHERVLLAEDDELVRSFLTDILEHCGYRVVGAADGEEAVRLYETAGPLDAAVLDVVLPKLNGKEVRERLRARNADLKAIFISGYGPDVMAAHAVSAEDLIVLPKPIDIENFLVTLRRVLDAGKASPSPHPPPPCP